MATPDDSLLPSASGPATPAGGEVSSRASPFFLLLDDGSYVALSTVRAVRPGHDKLTARVMTDDLKTHVVTLPWTVLAFEHIQFDIMDEEDYLWPAKD